MLKPLQPLYPDIASKQPGSDTYALVGKKGKELLASLGGIGCMREQEGFRKWE